mmetsp:Transcript_17275/g.46069  ORF Transcript_17275/g.46069 Transcript_17275/m.46069 type:complete len:183 (+) Transcript_17275:103-651(+)
MAPRRASPLALPVAALGAAALLRLAAGPAFSSSGMAARREMLGAVAAGVAALNAPRPALADWQGEPQRQLKKFGSQILSLESAVSKGDLAAIKPKLQKFELFSGAYRNDRQKRAAVEDVKDKIIEAVEDGKADTLKTEYAKLLELTGLKEKLKRVPVPKGARVVDLGSSGSGTAKFATDEFA